MTKDIILVLLVLISIGLLVVVLNLSEKTNKDKKSLEEEKYSRMVAEESLQRNAAKLSTLEAQLKKANEKMSKVQDLIDAEKTVNIGLQKQFEDLSKIKSDLEDKLKAVSGVPVSDSQDLSTEAAIQRALQAAQ